MLLPNYILCLSVALPRTVTLLQFCLYSVWSSTDVFSSQFPEFVYAVTRNILRPSPEFSGCIILVIPIFRNMLWYDMFSLKLENGTYFHMPVLKINQDWTVMLNIFLAI